MSLPKLLIADDHSLVAEALVKLLEPFYEIVGVAHDGHQLLEMVRSKAPDVLVVDLSMPMMNGFEVLERLRCDRVQIPCVLLTMHTEPGYIARAIELGAMGFVPKNAASTQLIQALESALAGHAYLPAGFDENRLAKRIPSSTDSPAQSLTPRQQQVLVLFAQGFTAKEVAQQLGISFRTAEGHKAAIMRQLALQSTADLVRFALQQGLLSMDASPLHAIESPSPPATMALPDD
jgi:DNA-binding NarL/FixJ family response regulator